MICCLKNHFEYDRCKLKAKQRIMHYEAHADQRKHGLVALIPGHLDFKTRTVIRDKEVLSIIVKWRIFQEDVLIRFASKKRSE